MKKNLLIVGMAVGSAVFMAVLSLGIMYAVIGSMYIYPLNMIVALAVLCGVVVLIEKMRKIFVGRFKIHTYCYTVCTIIVPLPACFIFLMIMNYLNDINYHGSQLMGDLASFFWIVSWLICSGVIIVFEILGWLFRRIRNKSKKEQ